MPSAPESEPRGTGLPERLDAGRERLAQIQEGLARHGEGFLAWLIRGTASLDSTELTSDFEAVFAGWYPDRTALITEWLSVVGWRERQELLGGAKTLASALAVDYGELWETCKESFAVEERLGGVYAFVR